MILEFYFQALEQLHIVTKELITSHVMSPQNSFKTEIICSDMKIVYSNFLCHCLGQPISATDHPS